MGCGASKDVKEDAGEGSPSKAPAAAAAAKAAPAAAASKAAKPVRTRPAACGACTTAHNGAHLPLERPANTPWAASLTGGWPGAQAPAKKQQSSKQASKDQATAEVKLTPKGDGSVEVGFEYVPTKK